MIRETNHFKTNGDEVVAISESKNGKLWWHELLIRHSDGDFGYWMFGADEKLTAEAYDSGKYDTSGFSSGRFKTLSKLLRAEDMDKELMSLGIKTFKKEETKI